ncbi:MAG: acetyltransferase [Pseudomonadota bacterium]
MTKPVVILGHGGHAEVLLDVLRLTGCEVAGILTPDLPAGSLWQGLEVLGGDDWLDCTEAGDHAFALGLGMLPHREKRRRGLFSMLLARGLELPAVIHPSAILARDVLVGRGVQIMAGVVVQPGVRIGDDALLNTRSSVDHHCHLGAHAHVAPGAVLCGDVHLGEGAFIGAGATVIQGISIGARAQVAAGATVVRDIEAGVRIIPGRAPIKFEEA